MKHARQNENNGTELPSFPSQSDMHIEESVMEVAISETGFGKFSIKVTIISYLIYLNSSLTTVSTGFVLPAAGCDFQMDTVDKGRFSTAYLAGSCVSPIICGFLSNLKGRKWTLIASLFLQGNSDFLQAFASNYWVILSLKFISGIAVSGQLFTVFTYISEFIPLKRRKSVLSLMEFFWVLGHALASVLGLVIIPLHIEITRQYFFFRSWNLYILICSSLAILIGIWLIYFPETPKYLAEIGSKDKLLQVLVDIYEQNSGEPGKEYIKKLMNSKNPSLIGLTNLSHDLPKPNEKSSYWVEISSEIKRVKSVMKPPIFKNTFLACVAGFSLSFAYFALFLWIPEIFQRFADFQERNMSGNPNFCTVSRAVYSSETTMNQEEDPFGCNRAIDSSVYLNNLLLCASCTPAMLPITFLVNRLGFRFFLVSHCFICSVTIVGIYFVSSSLQTLILLCVYISLMSVCITSSIGYFSTIFPTNLRSSGVTLTSLSSRIGGMVGNIASSYLIDHHCGYLVILIALQLVVSAISTMLIRR